MALMQSSRATSTEPFSMAWKVSRASVKMQSAIGSALNSHWWVVQNWTFSRL
jgi:hypothetical protein